MDIASYLTDVHGPRLTGSPNIRAAAEWAVKEMQGWGLANATLATWGSFGRGWTNDRYAGHLMTPSQSPIIGYPKAWTPGTNGPLLSEVVRVALANDADLELQRGKLKGKFILTEPERAVTAHLEPQARRFSDSDLAERARQPVAPPQGGGGATLQSGLPAQADGLSHERRRGGALEPGRGDGGTVSCGRRITQCQDPPSVPRSWWRSSTTTGSCASWTEDSGDARIRHREHVSRYRPERVQRGRRDSWNRQGRELVMLGAHFDSWHGGTGATDNAAGSAVMMEAMRILKATGLRLRRTVRIALWTGEEQGLLGSRAYVNEHFGEPADAGAQARAPEVLRYFNVDNGTGAIRGVYLQGTKPSRRSSQRGWSRSRTWE